MGGGRSQTHRAGCGSCSGRACCSVGSWRRSCFPPVVGVWRCHFLARCALSPRPCPALSESRLRVHAGFSWEPLPHRLRRREKRKEGRRQVGRKNSALGTDRRRPGFLWSCGLPSGLRGCYLDSPPHALQPRLGGLCPGVAETWTSPARQNPSLLQAHVNPQTHLPSRTFADRPQLYLGHPGGQRLTGPESALLAPGGGESHTLHLTPALG